MEITSGTKEETLTTDEEQRLKELENIIAKNFQGFYAVGCALAEIHSSRLYRKTHTTFEDYCRERFEIARRTAYQYIDAKKAMDNVRNCAQIELLPANEAQIRPLTKLSPEDQIQAWERVVSSAPFDGGVTAKHVSQVVGDMLGDMLKKRAESAKKKVADNPAVAQEFIDALWTLIEITRIESAKSLPVKMRANMRDSIRRVENLLED